MAADVVVRLLGEPSVTVDGRTVEALAAPRLLSLLGLLIVHRRTRVTRQRAAFALWPDSTEPQARTNLRHALHHVRRALPDADRHLDLDGNLLGWRGDSPADVDLVDLEAAVDAVAGGDRTALERAVDAYTGPLLPGAVDEWLEPVRASLHQEHVARLELLCLRCEEAGDRDASIRRSQQLLLADPLHEPTYRRLIRLYGPADRAHAVRTFHACAATLGRELGVRPSAATVAEYERLVATPSAAPTAESGAPSLVGRADERRVLVQAVRESAAGRCLVALVHGDPGIGKSHLVADVVAWCHRQGMTTVVTRAYEAEGRLALGPVADVLRAPALRVALGRLDEAWRVELARIVPELVANRPATDGIDATDRARLFAAVATAWRAACHPTPLVVAIDDLPWCDTETLELVHYIVRTSPGVPLVVLGTARDEGLSDGAVATFVDGLRALDALVDVPLAGLGQHDAGELVTATLGTRPPVPVMRRLVEMAAGNPLFLVELARHGVDPATGELHLPERVQAVIARRLGAVSAAAQVVVDVLAVVGRQAEVELLFKLCEARAGDSADALDELWRRRIFVEVGTDGYDFAHDHIRDVAYAAIGPARRRTLHRQVADAIRARRADDLDDVAATVAAHYERAGDAIAAIDHYERAIAVASRVFAHDEVIALAERALALIRRTPEGPARNARELAVLGPLAVATYDGPGHTFSLRRVFDRIAELRADGGAPLEAHVLRIAANAAIGERRFEDSDGIGAELLARGDVDHDPLLMTEGSYMRGVSSFWLGRLEDSAQFLERALATYDPKRRDVHILRFGQDPRAVCLIRLAMTSWHLGRLDVASRLRRQARCEAGATAHPYTIGYVTAFAAWAAYDAGADEELDELLASRVSSTNVFVRLQLDAYAALLAARRGHGAEEVDRLATIADQAQVDQPIMEPEVLVLLADVLGRAGRGREGLAAARRARVLAERDMPIMLTYAWWAEAELLRGLDASPGDLRTPLDAMVAVARRQGSLTMERRACSALAEWGLDGQR